MNGNHKFKHNPNLCIIELENNDFYNRHPMFTRKEISTMFLSLFSSLNILKLMVSINKYKSLKIPILLNLNGIILIENDILYYKTNNSIDIDLALASFEEFNSTKTFYEYDVIEVIKKQCNISCNYEDFLAMVCDLTSELGIYCSGTQTKFNESAFLESFELLNLVENSIDYII